MSELITNPTVKTRCVEYKPEAKALVRIEEMSLEAPHVSHIPASYMRGVDQPCVQLTMTVHSYDEKLRTLLSNLSSPHYLDTLLEMTLAPNTPKIHREHVILDMLVRRSMDTIIKELDKVSHELNVAVNDNDMSTMELIKSNMERISDYINYINSALREKTEPTTVALDLVKAQPMEFPHKNSNETGNFKLWLHGRMKDRQMRKSRGLIVAHRKSNVKLMAMTG